MTGRAGDELRGRASAFQAARGESDPGRHCATTAITTEAADFSLGSHRRVSLRMGELMSEGHRVDIVTMAEQLRRSKKLSVIGGVAWLAGLTKACRGGFPSKIACAAILSNLRESGSIEQDAEVVLFLQREEYYNRAELSLAGKGK